MDIKTKKIPMRLQDKYERRKNFSEVALGYTEEEALEEASRCINCKNKPCVSSCPVGIDIPRFIESIVEKKYIEAYKIISEKSCFPAICGRICPQESQCERTCTMGIKNESVAIGRLERFVADYYMVHNTDESIAENNNQKHKKVAVVGSGPSSLSCTGELVKMGYEVSVFEALHKYGGVLTYGIPEFRLPNNIVNYEINNLKKLGVIFNKNIVIGKSLNIDDLKSEGYDAIFIGTGAGIPMFMNIPGENLNGVYSANEYLTRVNLLRAKDEDSFTPIKDSKIVAVIGGGNVAMDAARSAVRLGAEKTYIIYRRSENELPARREEVENAKEEGIEFLFLNNPVEILPDKDNNVKSIKLIKMELGEPDQSMRRRPIPIKDSKYIIDVDTVIMALGTSPNPLLKKSITNNIIEFDKKGCIIVDEKNITKDKSIFAGGDAVTGAATVISAMGAGKNAAIYIDKYLSE